MKTLLPFLCLLISLQVEAQIYKGRVLDSKTKMPIENVNIYIKNSKKGTSTNRNGNFKLRVDSSVKTSDSIYFSAIGYFKVNTTLASMVKNNSIIFLDSKTEMLDNVMLTGKRKLNISIPYTKVAELPKGIHSFGTTRVGDSIFISGGDASYIEDQGLNALARIEDNPQASLMDLINSISVDPTYEKYNNTVQVFNTKNFSVTELPVEISKLAYHKSITHNDKLYLVSGKHISPQKQKEYLNNKIEVVDLKTLELDVDKANPHQAVNPAIFKFKDNMIVMGGSVKMLKDGTKKFTNKAHIYNFETGLWYKLPNMPFANEFEGVLVDNKIYIIESNTKQEHAIAMYNITTGKWQRLGKLEKTLSKPVITSKNNTIYIFNNKELMVFNTNTNALTSYNLFLDIEKPKLLLDDNNLFFIGGFVDSGYSKTASKDIYFVNLDELDNAKIVNEVKL